MTQLGWEKAQKGMDRKIWTKMKPEQKWNSKSKILALECQSWRKNQFKYFGILTTHNVIFWCSCSHEKCTLKGFKPIRSSPVVGGLSWKKVFYLFVKSWFDFTRFQLHFITVQIGFLKILFFFFFCYFLTHFNFNFLPIHSGLFCSKLAHFQVIFWTFFDRFVIVFLYLSETFHNFFNPFWPPFEPFFDFFSSFSSSQKLTLKWAKFFHCALFWPKFSLFLYDWHSSASVFDF